MMKTSLKALACVAVVLSMSACGKTKLTAEQKAKFEGTLTSMGRGQYAVKDGARGANLAAASRAENVGLPLFAASMPVSGDSQDQVRISMAQRMRESHCTFRMVEPVFSGTSFELAMAASGETCPVALDMYLKMEQTGSSSGVVKGNIKYSVKDEQFRKLNDVDGIYIDGSMTASGDQSSATAKLDFQGYVTSQKFGKIPTSITGKLNASQSGADGEISFSQTYPDFEAELTMKIDGRKATFELNGEEISQEQAMAYLSKVTPFASSLSGGMSGGGMSHSSSGPISGGGFTGMFLR